MMRSISSLVASSDNPIGHVADKPWSSAPMVWGGHVLSSQIAAMVLAALVLTVLMLLAARRRAVHPGGRGYNLLEVFVLFVRDFIARPALHESAYRFLPFLLTLFLFILFCNLIGLVPLLDISAALAGWVPALHGHPVGGTPTGNIWVTGALAGMTLLVIVGSGISGQVRRFVDQGRSPLLGWTVGFFLYLWSLVPAMPLPIKLVMMWVLIPLEFVGTIAKCFALAIRLFANMSAGHVLLAVLLLFISMASGSGAVAAVVTPASIAGSVAISLLELLVAFIQAFIFTFLAALFIGMSVHPHH